MNLMTSLLWRSIAKSHRQAALNLLPEIHQKPVDRLLKNDFRFNPCFDQQQCIFVHIPKCAGKSVVKALYNIDTIGHTPIYWQQIVDPIKFEQYFKFAFVRNPWDRAVSAFEFLKTREASKRDQEWSQFIQKFTSFDAFVQAWLTPENCQRQIHFVPQHHFIDDKFGYPCLDFLGKFETLQKDYDYIAKRLGLSQSLPHINKNRSDDYRRFYSDKSAEIVAKIYQRDIQLFDYQFDYV